MLLGLRPFNSASAKIQALDATFATIAFDTDGNIVEANDNFLSLVGYSLNEIRGRHHSLFVDPSEAETPLYRKFWQDLRLDGSYR